MGKERMGSHPTLHMDAAATPHTANAVPSPAPVRPAGPSGPGCPPPDAAPILLRHPLCGRKRDVHDF